MSYAKKTCNICGYKDIQPRMVRKAKKVEIATSKRGVTMREWLGLLLGNEQSIKSVRSWLFAPNKRVYQRTRTVWMCTECARKQ